MTVNREQLYAEVWADPMLKVAERYGVSSSFLARVCTQMNVPRPPRGYWARLRAGQSPHQPQLPEAQPGDETEWEAGKTFQRTEPPIPTTVTSTTEPRSSRKAMRKRHPLLAGVEAHFAVERFSDDGYLRPTKRRLVDIVVTPDQLPRALQTANKLFRTFENRGFNVTHPPKHHAYGRPALEVSGTETTSWGYRWHGLWYPDRPTVVFVGEVAIGLTLFELSTETDVIRVEDRYVKRDSKSGREALEDYYRQPRREHMPNGRLALRAYSPYSLATWEKQWHEARGMKRLSARSERIADDLVQGAREVARLVEEGKRQAEIRRRKWEEESRRLRAKWAEEARIKAVDASRKQLLEVIEEWSTACRVEGFFHDLMARTDELQGDEREQLEQRIERARRLFGGTDARYHFGQWKSPEDRLKDSRW